MREVMDNAVIGGGPAGSSLATLLAKQGRQVCLFERKAEPHHKVCGEFISWEASTYLEALGIDLPTLGARAIRQLRLIQGEKIVDAALPFTAWSLSRQVLDSELLKLAQRNGVEVRCKTPVRSLARGKTSWKLQLPRHEFVHARHCFLASGKYDIAGWRRPKPSKAMIGLKMHLELERAASETLEDVVEVHLFSGGYAGLELVEGGVANLCMLIETSVFNACGKDWTRLMDWLAERSPHLKSQLADAKSLWPRPLAVSGIPYGYIYRSEVRDSHRCHGSVVDNDEGLYRLGDQLAVIPSFAGDGIAIALHSAFLAAHCRQAGLSAHSYHRQAQRQLRAPVGNAQALNKLFASAIGQSLALRLGYHFPPLLQKAISHTRLQPLV